MEGAKGARGRVTMEGAKGSERGWRKEGGEGGGMTRVTKARGGGCAAVLFKYIF